jgi:hypothetical protein
MHYRQMLTAGLSAPLCGYAIAKLGLNGITLLSAAEVRPPPAKL